MADTIFVDTNVLVYALDAKFPGKRRRAQQWLDHFWNYAGVRLSWQVLHEFYWNATGKMHVPPVQARKLVDSYLDWDPVDSSAGLVRRAWEWCDAAQLAYWDALIVAAAEVCGAQYLLTEDLQAGREFGGVRVVDPFGAEGAGLLQTLS